MEPLFSVGYNETTIRKLGSDQKSQQTQVISDAQDYAKATGLKIIACLRRYRMTAHGIVRAAKEQHVDQIARDYMLQPRLDRTRYCLRSNARA